MHAATGCSGALGQQLGLLDVGEGRGGLPSVSPATADHLLSDPLFNADSARADRLGPLADFALHEAGEVLRAAPIWGDQHGTQAL